MPLEDGTILCCNCNGFILRWNAAAISPCGEYPWRCVGRQGHCRRAAETGEAGDWADHIGGYSYNKVFAKLASDYRKPVASLLFSVKMFGIYSIHCWFQQCFKLTGRLKRLNRLCMSILYWGAGGRSSQS